MKVLRRREVRERTGYSPATIDRLEKDGRFPKRVQLGPNAVGWLESEVNDWIATRVAERDSAVQPAA